MSSTTIQRILGELLSAPNAVPHSERPNAAIAAALTIFTKYFRIRIVITFFIQIVFILNSNLLSAQRIPIGPATAGTQGRRPLTINPSTPQPNRFLTTLRLLFLRNK
jgi:hypothetical protein